MAFIRARHGSLAGTAVFWWATVGAAFLLMQVLAVGSWALRHGWSTTLAAGAVPTTESRTAGTVFTVALALAATAVIIVVARDAWRRRTVTFPLALAIAGPLGLWTELTCDFRRDVMVYGQNIPLLVHSWIGDLPGFRNPGPWNMPVLIPLCGYIVTLTGVTRGTCRVLRWARLGRSRRHRAMAVLLALGFGAVISFIAFTVVIRLQVLWFPAVALPWQTLFYGTVYQYPLYDSILFGAALASVSLIRYYPDGNGLTSVERGVDRIRPELRPWARILAVTGMWTLTLTCYGIAHILISFAE